MVARSFTLLYLSIRLGAAFDKKSHYNITTWYPIMAQTSSWYKLEDGIFNNMCFVICLAHTFWCNIEIAGSFHCLFVIIIKIHIKLSGSNPSPKTLDNILLHKPIFSSPIKNCTRDSF